MIVNGVGTTLYGHAAPQPVSGEECVALERDGFVPYSYQAVRWFVVLYLPVVPRGCFRVSSTPQSFWNPSVQYVMRPVPFALRQVLVHYAVGWGLLALLIGGFWWLVSR